MPDNDMVQDISVDKDTRTTEDLDKLADSTETSRNGTRGMTQETAPAKEAAKSKTEEYELEIGGKKVKGTREQVIKWAQMGYDRPQFMQKYNQAQQERAKLKEQEKTYGQKYSVYQQIDDYAAKNPEWWNYIQQGWQTRGTHQPGATPAATTGAVQDPRVDTLASTLNQVQQFIQQTQQEKQIAFQKEKDQELDSEIKSIRESHKDLDWDSIDENGKSLELRILEHGSTNGIPTFRAAMRDLLHDDLLARASSQAKISVAQGIQQKTKLGVLGTSPTPTKWTPKSNKPIRQTSYEDLEAEIREELRQGVRA
jgi:hypothetical protein